MKVATVTEASEAAALRGEWDGLAVAARRPYCAPAWMLAWWTHARPAGAQLRIVTVRDAGRLVGLAPLYAERAKGGGWRYRLLGARLAAPVGPLLAEGCGAEVFQAIAGELKAMTPTPHVLRLDGQDVRDACAARLTAAWPAARPWVHHTPTTPAPTVELDAGSYDEWLSAKSGNFRQQARRFRRRLERDGARLRTAGPGEASRAIEAFAALHEARWSARGGSKALVDGLVPMLTEVAERLMPTDRFRACIIDVDGEIVSSQLFLAAGGEVSYWNGGFDDRWAEHKPALQTLLFAVGEAIACGDTRLDLGPGENEYKRRMADGEYAIATTTLAARDLAYPVSRARLVPYQGRWALSRRLSDEAKARLRRAVGRLGRG